MISVLVAALLFVLLCYVAFVSFMDGENRAALVGVALAIVTPLPFVLVGLLDFPFQRIASFISLTASGVAAGSLFLPIRGRNVWRNDTPKSRIDERDIMFSRGLLEPGTERFEEYYDRKPEKKTWDDKFRCRPGLLAEGATFYDPFTFRAAEASFDTIEQLRPFVDGTVAKRIVGVEPSDVTTFLKEWAKNSVRTQWV
jgi:hypothetical protein